MRPSLRISIPASRQLMSDPERVDEGQLSSILSALSSALTATTSVSLSSSSSRTVVPTSTRTVHLIGVTGLSETLTITDSVVATATVTDQDTDIDNDDVTTVTFLSFPDTSSLGSAAAALVTGDFAFVSNRLGLTLPTAPATLGSRADEVTTVTIPDSTTSTEISSSSQAGPVALDPTYIEFSTPIESTTTTIIGPTTTLGAVIDSRPGVGFTIIDPLTGAGADATQQDAGTILTIIAGGPDIVTATGVSADPVVVTVASLTAGASVITVTPVPPGPSLITVLPAPQDPVVFTSTPAQGAPSVITVLPAAAPSVVTILPAPVASSVATSFVLATPSDTVVTATVTVVVTAPAGYVCAPTATDAYTDTETSLAHTLAPGAAGVFLFAMVGMILMW